MCAHVHVCVCSQLLDVAARQLKLVVQMECDIEPAVFARCEQLGIVLTTFASVEKQVSVAMGLCREIHMHMNMHILTSARSYSNAFFLILEEILNLRACIQHMCIFII